MTVAPVWHGNLNSEFGTVTLDTGLTGIFGTGTFTMTAAGTMTISDAAVMPNSQIMFSAANSAAGLLLRGKSCWIGSISTGTFAFNVSATGAGAPAGTELFAYYTVTES